MTDNPRIVTKLGRIRSGRVTKMIQEWARVRSSGHFVHRPYLAAQLLHVRKRNGWRDALEMRDRIIRINAYPLPARLWPLGKSPDWYDYHKVTAPKLSLRNMRRRAYRPNDNGPWMGRNAGRATRVLS